jgi:tripartite-type tricarboxylate transporter receptor subunit TctC
MTSRTLSHPDSTSLTRRTLLQAAAGAAAMASPLVRAQSAWPNKPVTFVVPFPSGGGTDAFARPLTALLTRSLGKQVIIDNRGGAGGNVGATIAAKSAADGYTFFMGAVHHTIAPSMYPKLDYNLEADFIPVGLIASVPQVIVVNPQRVHRVRAQESRQAQLRFRRQRHLTPLGR